MIALACDFYPRMSSIQIAVLSIGKEKEFYVENTQVNIIAIV